ncbi:MULTISPECIES: superoxide dismutase family protein [Pseudanabaena]|nr:MULTISPECIES: superoxide dismutase family protein [Pseudanabaena]MDG3493017.1 superoxide dismutase family protein [Pseudanabaena catenata USMAC16]
MTITAATAVTSATVIAQNATSVIIRNPQSAIASIFNIKGEQVGTATFTQTPLGLQVIVNVENLTQGEHMIHIHENGKCDAPDFKTSGNHFNPKNPKDDDDDNEINPMHGNHGAHENHEKHEGEKHNPAGDLPNIVVKKDGKGKLNALLPRLSLDNKPNSLLKQGGTSILIHAGANGNSTIPNVDYKTRIACGVIKKF